MDDDTASDGQSTEYQSIIKEFRAFLSDCKDVLDEVTTMKLLERYSVMLSAEDYCFMYSSSG